MSRYEKELPGGRRLAWGYDNPLGEYFFMEYYSKEEMKKKRNKDDELVYDVSSHCTLKPHPETPKKFDYSNSEILEYMKRYISYIPEEHLIAVALDKPY